jgi:NADH-quinone oxidoreductase subunit J
MEIFLNILTIFGVIAALGVISFTNPIHSILALIIVFSLSGISILTIGLDFLGILYILIYVGAIAVIFLFVIMCLNLEPRSLLRKINYIPIISSISFILTIGFSIVFSKNTLNNIIPIQLTHWEQILASAYDIEVIGQVFFFFFPLPIIILGITLLIAMIGAIFLTFTEGNLIRRQDVYYQTVSYDYIIRELL